MVSSLIRRFAIDTEDLATVNYQKELEHIMQQTVSDKAIQRMNAIHKEAQQAMDPEKPLQLISNQEGLPGTSNQEGLPGARPAVRPASKPAKYPESIIVEDLTKAFEKLNVSLVQYMQQQQPRYLQPGGFYGQYSYSLPAAALEATQGDISMASVGAYSMDQGTYGRAQGVCWYCFNRDLRFQHMPHRTRERYP